MRKKFKGKKQKNKRRKAHPQPAHYFWLDVDGCWACQNRNNCGNCKMLKREAHAVKEKIKRKEKNELRNILKDF